jgi:hypothetical protein
MLNGAPGVRPSVSRAARAGQHRNGRQAGARDSDPPLPITLQHNIFQHSHLRCVVCTLLSRFMAYHYRCASVDGDDLDPVLHEWATRGWELVTATVVIQPREIHYLYFRIEASQDG